MRSLILSDKKFSTGRGRSLFQSRGEYLAWRLGIHVTDLLPKCTKAGATPEQNLYAAGTKIASRIESENTDLDASG